MGQRVRGKSTESVWCTHLEGAEMVITGEDLDWTQGEYWLLSAISARGKEVACWKAYADDYLEPILPEGSIAGEFSSVEELIDSLQVTA